MFLTKLLEIFYYYLYYYYILVTVYQLLLIKSLSVTWLKNTAILIKNIINYNKNIRKHPEYILKVILRNLVKKRLFLFFLFLTLN